VFADSGDALADPAQLLSFYLTAVEPADATDMFYLISGVHSTSLNFRSGVLDFETGMTQFTLSLEIRDNGYPSQSVPGEVIISILNVNEAPVFDLDIARYCVENAYVGYEVRNPNDVGVADPDAVERSLTDAVTDVDLGDGADNCCSAITFSINTAEQDVFELYPNSGSIVVANNSKLDFEGPVTSWYLEVTAANADGLSDTASVRVYLYDEEEVPYILNEDAAFSVSEKVHI
jgi:hypothetical protein